MIDLNRQLKILMRTGKFALGSIAALDAAKSGRAKMIILASNCPELDKSAILRYAAMSGIAAYLSEINGHDLGTLCERPHVISAISISEAGDSEILQLVGN